MKSTHLPKIGQRKKPASLTGVEYEILQLIREYHFLTVEQLLRLRYKSGSLTYAQTLLKDLFENKYLDRRRLPDVRLGNQEYIYALSTHGMNFMRELGYTSFSRFRPERFDSFSFPHLQHVLSLNDVLIAARLLPRTVPAISLVAMRHDLDLKHSPIKVAVDRRMPDGDRVDEKVTIIPDGWLDFRLEAQEEGKKERRRCIVVELDRGSESNMTPFKQKLRAYYAYAISEEYQALFGTNLIITAYATTAGQTRLKTMIKWCEQELTQQRLEHEANLYRFVALPPGELDPKQLFCEPIWYKPFDPDPISLLWQQ